MKSPTKLNAFESIGSLKKILFSHHDYWVRRHSAYALAYLMDKSDSLVLEKRMQTEDLNKFLFGFGEGLLKKNDLDGLRYMKINYLPGAEDEIHSLIYYTSILLEKVNGITDPRLEEFYRYLLRHSGLLNLFKYEIDEVKFRYTVEDKDMDKMEDQIVTIFKKMINEIIRNGFTTLYIDIHDIGEKTRSQKILNLSKMIKMDK